MRKRANLYGEGDTSGIRALEKELLIQNANYKDWYCIEELMKATKDGKVLRLHCLSVGINDVGCADGEVETFVFDRCKNPLYKEVSYKPYVIVAVISLAKFANSVDILEKLEERKTPRVFE